MRKKFLSFLIIMLAVLLVGCNKGKKSTTTTLPTSTTENQELTYKEKLFGDKSVDEWREYYKDTIGIDRDNNGVPDWQETQMTIRWAGNVMWDETKYNTVHRNALDWAKQYPNITIERDERFLSATGDHWTLLELMISAAQNGSMPDFYFSHTLAEYYDQGLTLDLTPYLRTDPEARYLTENAIEYMTSFDGKEITSVVFAIFPTVAGVNTGLLKSLNIDPPSPHWTYEEYEEIRRKVGEITTNTDRCVFPSSLDFLLSGANYFDSMPGGYNGYNTKTRRFEFDKAPRWGEWQEQWVDEIDLHWHFWDLPENERIKRCGNFTWPWGDGFQAILEVEFWWMSFDTYELKVRRGMEYELYPYPTAPEGGNTQLFGWFDTWSLSYTLAQDPVKAEAVFNLVKWLSYGEEGLTNHYTFWEKDIDEWGWSREDYEDRGGDPAEFTPIHPLYTIMDYIMGWPATTNPNVISKHPLVVGFPEDSPMNIYNYKYFKDPYFQDQLSNTAPRVRRDHPGVYRAMSEYVYYEMLQNMRDEGYSWNDLAPEMTERMNQKLDMYIQTYNKVK